jgi:hypothetical protein
MEIFANLALLNDASLSPHLKLLAKQCYWLIAFLIAVCLRDVDTLMEIVYDEKRILPRHAQTLAGKAVVWLIRRYAARQYVTYRILRDMSVKFKHSLYDIWLLLPELRPAVDVVRKEFGQQRSVA